jgi:rhodanese-related sulfurtransferase
MKDITAEELKQRLENSEDLAVIDVREVYEYQRDNIGSINIPLGQLPYSLDQIEKYKESELVMFCQTGNRSEQAKMFLQMQGFNKVRNALGGIEGYRRLGT